MKSAILGCVLAVLGCGCTTTDLYGYRDPNYRKYDKIAVLASNVTPAMAAQMQNRICAAAAPTDCLSASAILPPTREWSIADARAAMIDASVGAILIINGTGDQTQSGVVGVPVIGQSTTTGSLSAFGNTATYSERTTSTPSGVLPIYYSQRNSATQISLVDISTGQQVYVASSSTLSSTATDAATAASLAKKIAKDLRSQGLL